MGAPMGDLAGGIFAAHGVLAALYQRERTQEGSRVDVALLDSQIALLIYRAVYYFMAGEIAQPSGSGHVSAVPIGAFQTQDIHIVIDVITSYSIHYTKLYERTSRSTASWPLDGLAVSR